MNKAYFQYLLKSKKKLFVFLSVFNFLFPTLTYFISVASEWNDEIASICIVYASLLLFAECIILPILHFLFLHNKKGVDTYFALPISKHELYITNLVLIVLEVVLPHLFSILPILCFEMVVCGNTVNILYLLLYILTLMFVIAALVMGVFALILKTNTALDAFVMIGMYMIAPLLIYSSAYIFMDEQIYGLSAYHALEGILSVCFLPLTFVKTFPIFGIHMFEYHVNWFMLKDIYVSLGVFVFIALISLISIVYDIKHRKAEDAEQLSTNIFTYPFMIILITFTLILDVIFTQIEWQAKATFIVFIFLVFTIMTCIYKRKITFTKKGIVIFVLTIILGYTTVFASNATNAFGLEYAYKKENTLSSLTLNWNFYNESMDEYYYIDIITKEEDSNFVIDKEKAYGAYTYEDLIAYLHAKQTKFVEEYKYYKTGECCHHSVYVTYDKNKNYQYYVDIKIDESMKEECINDLKFLSNFDFIEINILHNYSNADGFWKDEYLTISQFEKVLNELN